MPQAVLFPPRIGRESLQGHGADDEVNIDYEDGEDDDDGADDDMDEDDIGWNLLQQFLVLLSTSQCVLGGHL